MKLLDILSKDAIARLRMVVRDKHALDASQVKIVGLDDIRRVAGPKWPEIADRVRTRSMYFLERRLGPDDVIVPAGDGFLILYGESSPGEMASKAAALQEALNEFYLGEEGMALLRSIVEPRTIQSEALAKLLGDMPDAPVAPAQAESPQWVAASHELAFLPVWNVTQEAITGYWPTPVRGHGRMALYGYDSPWLETAAHDEEADFLAIDLEMLEHAEVGIETSLATGRRCLVGYSVHATTMQNRNRRQAFLQRLKAVPEASRTYLLGRIAEIEPGTPAMTISEWVHQLRPISLRVALELHHSERTLNWVDSVGVFSVSCALPARPKTDDERHFYASFLQKWSTGIRRQGLKFRLDNVINSQLMAQALDGGIDFCSSEIFWPPTSAPDGMKPYKQARLRRELGLVVNR